MFPVALFFVPSVKAFGNDQSSKLWWKLCHVWTNAGELIKITSVQWDKALWNLWWIAINPIDASLLVVVSCQIFDSQKKG